MIMPTYVLLITLTAEGGHTLHAHPERMLEDSSRPFEIRPGQPTTCKTHFGFGRASAAHGSAEMLNWLVNEHGIEPHIPVFDKSQAYRRHLLAEL